MKFSLTLLLVLVGYVLVGCNPDGSDIPALTKHVEVFGIPIHATARAPDDKLLHAANVLAEYLDNDEDGVPDNQRVVDALVRAKAVIIMTKDSGEEWQRIQGDLHDVFPDGVYHDQFADESIPNAAAHGKFDGCWEEILHLITRHGYGNAYPSVFGLTKGTAVAEAVDLARGGHFEDVPEKYPDDAWYTYYDESCRYGCQMDEYLYWALTSILGAQDFSGRLERIGNEWPLNTQEKVKEHDPAIYALLTDPQYKFPTVLPDGNYRAGTFTIENYALEIRVQDDNYIPPEGRYPATVSFVTECQAPGGEGIKISFTVSGDSEYGGRKLSLVTGTVFTLDSELFSIISAIRPKLKNAKTVDGINIKSIEGHNVWLTTEPRMGNSGSVFPKIVKIEPMDR